MLLRVYVVTSESFEIKWTVFGSSIAGGIQIQQLEGKRDLVDSGYSFLSPQPRVGSLDVKALEVESKPSEHLTRNACQIDGYCLPKRTGWLEKAFTSVVFKMASTPRVWELSLFRFSMFTINKKKSVINVRLGKGSYCRSRVCKCLLSCVYSFHDHCSQDTWTSKVVAEGSILLSGQSEHRRDRWYLRICIIFLSLKLAREKN